MIERKYSVAEIDAMRNAISWVYPGPGVPFYKEEADKAIEERIRTYMSAGVDPQELIDQCGKTIAAWQQR